jgi:4-diphosphocytidyl-2-C-methyl-D-erythritol kinase
MKLVVPAPAKINLFLHVTGRRVDGYHTLETLFALIDWCDTITLSDRDDGAVVRARPLPGIADDDDLALRAARALKDETRTPRGVTIDVVKNVPVGAGLGGGSSDAASVLLALNRFWNLRLPRRELESMALALGADVPFFIRGEPAIARGIGEVLTPISLPRAWLALAIPRTHVPTASIFAAPELTRNAPSAKMNVFSEGYGRNDLEAVAAARFPDVARAIDALRRASPDARMTGSGACAFAPFANENDARHALTQLPPGIAGRAVRTLDRHPLASFA